MRWSVRRLIWIGGPALIVGLVMGVAIGRSRPAFEAGLAQEAAAALREPNEPMPSISPISVTGLQALVASAVPIALVDVRETDEYLAVHIPGARSIPLGELWSRHGEIPRDRTVVVYCTGDLRAKIGALELVDLGLTDVRHLEGGLSAWQNTGLAVQGRDRP